MPVFQLRPTKGNVSFSTEFEFFEGDDETPGIWDCMISPLVDKESCVSTSSGTKTKRNANTFLGRFTRMKSPSKMTEFLLSICFYSGV